MLTLGIVILGIHLFLVAVLCLFGLHRLSMVFRWLLYGQKQYQPKSHFEQLPSVTVQIPLYNEKFVASRVIDCICALDYPTDKLQIQIVDDSTDDTVDLVAAKVAEHRAKGVNIDHVHRVNRSGFKAGALKDAMEFATGEFIAIFDSDFVPDPDFLHKTIHHFTDDKIGMVQTRWEHLNRFSNRLTEPQALMLDAHFTLEQQVRCETKCLFNFNGTAGLWRKETIYDAGNWSADTLTEDLDLSYRAQMRGWELRYLNDVECPAELPSNLTAFKSQQHRWAKGGVQVMKKMLGTVWRAPIGFWKKVESTFHLGNNLAYLIVLFDTLFFLAPSIFIREQLEIPALLWFDFPLFALSSGGHLVYLFFGQIALGRSYWRAFLNLPILIIVGIQLAFNNARAALEAILDKKSEFVRTPKSGELLIDGKLHKPKSKESYLDVLPKGEQIEVLIAAIYCLVLYWAVVKEFWHMVPFLILLITGFSMSTVLNVSQKLVRR